ncbi:MAG TPA: EamA family transporter [Chloroflexi bacterium]|nr:EamA family transporter [Chloroflexota bacterium]
MTLLAVILILISALFHALWNLLAKRAQGGVAFTWLFSALAIPLWAPVVVMYVLFWQPQLAWPGAIFILGSSAFHVSYFLTLQRGYRTGDLSVVYPLARGTGPLLSLLGAVLLLDERPTLLAIAGASLIIVGVFIIAGGEQMVRRQSIGADVGYGLLTGLLIAIYTLWDKAAVSTLLVAPLLLEYGSSIGRTLILSPLAWQQRHAVGDAWRTSAWEAIGIAIFSSLAYILVLTALITAPVSYIAPLREVSILLGALLGARLLGEGQAPRRLLAAGVMVLGIALLILG